MNILDQLEKAIDKATPGEWYYAYDMETGMSAIHYNGGDVVDPGGGWACNLEYIALANPATVKKLLDVARAAKSLSDRNIFIESSLESKWAKDLRVALKNLESGGTETVESE